MIKKLLSISLKGILTILLCLLTAPGISAQWLLRPAVSVQIFNTGQDQLIKITSVEEGLSYSHNVDLQTLHENILTQVELSSFNAATTSSDVNLSWSTGSETDNKGFEIERKNKSENEKWKAIAFIEGKGTTTDKQYYSYTDKHVEDGVYGYKLIQVAFDGSEKAIGNIEVTVNNIPDEYALLQNYPNPFNPTTTISYQIPKGSYVSLKVYDLIGNEVADLVELNQEAGTYKVQFNAQNLPSGVYFYRLQAGKFVSVKKLILMK